MTASIGRLQRSTIIAFVVPRLMCYKTQASKPASLHCPQAMPNNGNAAVHAADGVCFLSLPDSLTQSDI